MQFVIAFQFLKQLPSTCLMVLLVFQLKQHQTFKKKIGNITEGFCFQGNKGDFKKSNRTNSI